MANMLYNGVELPDIESVWTNKTAYPYALILHESSNGSSELLLTSQPLYADGNSIYPLSYPSKQKYYIKSASSEEWSLFNTQTVQSGYHLHHNDNTYSVWSNHDILNSDGTLYLAASDPIDPNAPTGLHLPSFYAGLAFSLAGPIIRGKSGTGMYSYNGVVLPKLPEWDREVYPFAFILYIGGLVQAYRLYLTPEITYKSAGDDWIIGHADNSCSYSAYDGEWKLYTEYPSGNDSLDSVENTIWANTDLLNEDGSVCLAKSEPVPVYE